MIAQTLKRLNRANVEIAQSKSGKLTTEQKLKISEKGEFETTPVRAEAETIRYSPYRSEKSIFASVEMKRVSRFPISSKLSVHSYLVFSETS